MAEVLPLERIVEEFPAQMQTPVRQLVQWLQAERGVTRADFSELQWAVRELATAQARAEERLTRLEAAVEKLTAAQIRAEERLTRVEERLTRLEAAVEKLAEAQARTEQQVRELAAAQARTEQRVASLEEHMISLEERMASGFKSLSDQIAALGGRWGIYTEGTFRATIQGLLGEIEGIEIREGYYGGRQVDVVIRDDEHIILEITSRMHPKDIENLYQSADDYRAQEGVEPKLMMATSYISPRLMQKVMGLARPIEIFSYEPDGV